MYISSPHLYCYAADAYKKTSSAPDDLTPEQHPALVAVIFAVTTLEAFVNEIAEMCLEFKSLRSETVDLFTDLFFGVADRSPLTLKYEITKRILTGTPFDKGSPPFQDFALLLNIRNEIIHMTPDEKHELQDGELVQSQHKILEACRARGLVSEFDDKRAWYRCIQNRATARFACKVVADIIEAIHSEIIDERLRASLAQHFDGKFPRPKEKPPGKPERAKIVGKALDRPGREAKPKPLPAEHIPSRQRSKTRPVVSALSCQMTDALGVRYEIRLVRNEGGAIPAPWRWSADVSSTDPMTTLAKGMAVAILNKGRSVEASILSVEAANHGACIAGKGDPPWPRSAGPRPKEKPPGKPERAKIVGKALDRPGREAKPKPLPAEHIPSRQRAKTRPSASAHACQMTDALGVRYDIRLVKCEGGATSAPWRWFADVSSTDPMTTLAKGMAVAILNKGRSVEASILSVEATNRSARIAGKSDPPWPRSAGR